MCIRDRSAAYDILPVNIILPEDQEELALTLNGKKKNLRRSDFLKFAEICGINRKSTEKMINNLILKTDDFILLCGESYLPEDMKENLKQLIIKRKERLL